VGRRAKAHAPGERRSPAPGLTLDALACGLIVVALAAVPALFNPRGQNAFGVIKAGLLQVLGLVAGACAALHLWSDRRPLRAGALSAAAALVVAAFGIATACGVAPALSFFADGPRHEGMYVILALAAAGFAISTFEGEQLDAVVTAIVVGSIGPSVYAIVQTIVGTDPSPEALPMRAGSTLGNPILFGGYLVTVIPITAAVAGGAWSSRATAASAIEKGVVPLFASDRPRKGVRPLFREGLPAYWIVLGLQLTALLMTRGRGAWLSLLIATAATIGVATIDLTGRRRHIVAALGAGAIIVAIGVAMAAVRARDGTFAAGETLQVRMVIWQHVVQLMGARPERLAIGYGPEMLRAVAAPLYSSVLARLEGESSVPDRAHNDVLDTVVSAGLIGVVAVLTLHLVLWTRLLRFVRRSPAIAAPASSPSRWLAAGLLASGLAHFVEIQTGIATISSRLIWWSCIGIVAAWARGARLPRVETAPRPPVDVTTLAAAAAIAALAFAFWQPGTGFSAGAVFVLAATGAVAILVSWNVPTPARTVVFARCFRAGAVVAVMIAGLAAWDAAAPRIGVIEAANWMSHQSTASFLFFLLAAGAIGFTLGRGQATRFGWRTLVGYVAAGAVAILVMASSAPRARADLLAQTAGQLTLAQRWSEAGLLEEERVRLTPESDRAWSSLGSIELDIARHTEGTDRGEQFARASAALAEARRRNPFDWFHIRNQASAERVWAAADRTTRAVHLVAADRLFGEAAVLAPVFPRLWAEWGNVAAERGDLHDAFVKLDRATALGGGHDAKIVADAILGATGFDVRDRDGRIRAAADLRRQGFPSLAGLYNARVSDAR
jgi:O-antigen ligase/polysaccharide polymerase Wzy-like membrane protein